MTECPDHYGYEQPPEACNECHKELHAKYLELVEASRRVVEALEDEDIHFKHCDQRSRKCLCCGCQCGTEYLSRLLPEAP